MPRKIIRRSPSVTDIAPPEPVAPPTSSRAKRPSMMLPIIVVAVLVCAGFAAWKYFPTSSKGATGAQAATDQAAELAKQVAKHVLVNTSESPMIATVQDPDTLRAQNPVFYKDAQQGDRLLIWSDKAVLYSPSRDVVLAMLSMSAFNAGSASTTTPPPSKEPTQNTPSKEGIMVEVRNGSATPGLARKVADQLKAEGWKIVTIADAKVKPVAKTEIFVSSKKPLGTLTNSLETSLKGSQITSLGAEPTTSADILVIVGNDFQP